MQHHNILSARYASEDTSSSAPVIAEHAIYGEQTRRANDDIEGGGMLAYLAGGGVIDAYEPPAPTDGNVNTERDQRMAVYTFNGVDYNFDPDSRDNISGAAVLAIGAISAGAQPNDLRWANPNQDFGWIALDNSVTPMDAQTCWAFAQAAASYKSALIFAARTLKDMNPIPSNYTDDSYWPS